MDDVKIQTVTIVLPAAWYANLLEELQMASCLYGRHDPHNAKALWRMCVEQGGATVAELPPEPAESPEPPVLPAPKVGFWGRLFKAAL